MMSPDQINAMFEGGCGILCLLNIVELLKSKKIAGIHWAPTIMFTLWGFWNLYYYPALGQWYSWFGGVVLVTANVIWLMLVALYGTQRSRKKSNV